MPSTKAKADYQRLFPVLLADARAALDNIESASTENDVPLRARSIENLEECVREMRHLFFHRNDVVYK